MSGKTWITFVDIRRDVVYEFSGLERENVRKGPGVWKNFSAKFYLLVFGPEVNSDVVITA